MWKEIMVFHIIMRLDTKRDITFINATEGGSK